ncbi:MAG: dTDP-4-dehydrorhamnose 3,5-epimerase family protein [Anaerolineae bacterium]|nr:dTDP-4-dehydrorhamnose 3,5-epimerase family protein [Anaerolineae bacterium]
MSMTPDFIRESAEIADVHIVSIRTFSDERGRFMETFRREWFPEVDWSHLQGNRSESKAGVLRGLHFHRKQVDYWYVMNGRIRVGMVDMRRSSRTYMSSSVLEIGEENNVGVFIPIGVAHGFYALTDTTLTYLVNQYYDGGDELGVAWNDPDLGLDWGFEQPPLLSPRDERNPRLRDIAAHLLPD